MRSKPTEPRSIASQLVILFTLAAALLLCSGLGVFYFIVVRHAFEEDNMFLADKISALRANLGNGGPAMLVEEVKSLRTGEHAAYWLRVIDAQGRPVIETPGMNHLLPTRIFPRAQTAKSSAISPKDYRTGDKLFSLVATPEQSNGQPYTIQIAQDRSADERFKKQFGILLVAVLAIGLLASSLIAITVTKRGLRPLTRMVHALERIGPTHLQERMAATQWPEELQPLALAFDQMLERLEESFTRLSQFSADLAHELRTPIGNILGEAQVALTRARTPDEYREVIESSVAESEKLSAIVDNLLFLARADAADRQIERTLFDGRAAIEKIASYYRPIAEERRVTISCAGEGEIYADAVLFERAVSNLVDNAVRFTPDGGTILVSVAADRNQSAVSIKDNGCGIATSDLSRVFDRFYRIDRSRSSDGAGLGLALVKSIADLHGGSATAESKVNIGTTMTLKFPHRERTETAR